MLCAARGYRAIIVVPETASIERIKLMRAYGAQVVLTPGADGMRGAVERAEALARENANAFIPSQFDNPENANAHYLTTGPEIWAQTEGHVDALVAGVGTGGTITASAAICVSASPMCSSSRWSLPPRRFSPRVTPGRIRFRASAPISCPPCWIAACFPACKRWKTTRPLP